MIPSSRNPTGLLGLFGVKTGGRLPGYPDEPLYVPMMDLLRWVLEDTQLLTVATGVLAVPAGIKQWNSLAQLPATPPGTMRLLLNFGGVCLLTGATQQQLSLGIQYTPISTCIPLIEWAAKNQNQDSVVTPYEPKPFLAIPPGAQLYVGSWGNFQAGANNFTWGARYVDVPC